MRHMILECFYPYQPKILLNPSQQEHLLDNPLHLVRHVLENMDYPKIFQRETMKKIGGTGFPSEYAFQAEVAAILRSCFFPSKIQEIRRWFILVEAKEEENKRRRADILIRNGKRLAIELKSGKNFGKILILNPNSYKTMANNSRKQ